MRKTEEKTLVKKLTKIGERLMDAGFSEHEKWHISGESHKQIAAAKLIKQAVEILEKNQKAETMYEQLGITLEKFEGLSQ